MENFRAVILAAGRGSRMGKLTDNQPKCMVKLGNQALIDWQIKALKKAGIKQIYLIKGYLADHFQPAGIYGSFENVRWNKTNMVSSLICGAQILKSNTSIISYSDIIYSKKIVKALIQKPGDIVITYDKKWLVLWRERFEAPLSDAETFRTNTDGALIEIGNRASDIEQIKGQYMGLLKISPVGWEKITEFLSEIPQSVIDKMDMTSLLKEMLKKKIVVHTVAVNGGWCEVDSKEDLNLYESMLKNGRLKI